jgi:ubiquinone/menaquinone biosynthesis C-methylase UbiE
MLMSEDVQRLLKQAYRVKACERDEATPAPWKVEECLRFAAELKQRGMSRLLEVGSGPGHDGRRFLEQGLAVVCVDLCAEMVTLCRAKGLEAYELDVLQLSLPAASFDSATAAP